MFEKSRGLKKTNEYINAEAFVYLLYSTEKRKNKC